ncbi:MAG: glutaredoxin family protein [Smithellaceae bacterium]|nr:glutaredoxin family protein [Syntrophaceae bacterium]MDD4240239.1 glutaredoxin family protein [Smithellaceae bacterium]NLX52343.1 glutaredoxin family protein [Deltaproteobacteria bacterium]
MKKILFFSLTVVLLLAGTGGADFYTWEDEAGVTHITDYPPPKNQKNVKLKMFEETSSDRLGNAAAHVGEKPEIILYTKNDCAECDKAREFLAAQNMTSIEYNIDLDRAALKRRKAIDDSEEVPLLVVGRTQVYGFSEVTYNRALKALP